MWNLRKMMFFSMIIAGLFYIQSCDKDKEEDPVEKDFFCEVIPEGWECDFLDYEKKFEMFPEITDKPLFVVRYINPDSTYTLNKKTYNPEMYLVIYSIDLKDKINFYIENNQSTSECYPVNYGEKKPFMALTTPCLVNKGTTILRAMELMAPLHLSFGKKMKNFNSSMFYTGE